MLHTLEDFCAWYAPASGEAQLRRRYYQLHRLMEARFRKRCYRTLLLAKRGGGTRRVLAPSEPLKRVQRAILRVIEQAEVSPHAAAYRMGRGVLYNAAPHAGQPLLVRLDIRDFFGSIRFAQVFSAIDGALKQSPLVGRHYLNAYDRAEYDARRFNQVLSFCFARLCTLEGSLVQGAPTSPMLSNLVFYPVDNRIAAYCAKRGIIYTRYSDDLTFSGNFNPHALISFIRRLLAENRFALHEGKTAILGKGVRQSVTGVVVNQTPHASRPYRRKIRQELYYLNRFGLLEHLRRLEETAETPLREEPYLRGLLGRIAFVLQVCPTDAEFIDYRKQACALLQALQSNSNN